MVCTYGYDVSSLLRRREYGNVSLRHRRRYHDGRNHGRNHDSGHLKGSDDDNDNEVDIPVNDVPISLYGIRHQYPEQNLGPIRDLASSFTATRADCYGLSIKSFDGSSESDVALATRFSPPSVFDGHGLATASELGCINFIDTRCESGDQPVNTFVAHGNAIFDIDWNINGNLITASADTSLCLFDMNWNDMKWDSTTESKRLSRLFLGHTDAPRCVRFRRDDPNVFVSAGRDGQILLWDQREMLRHSDELGRDYSRPVYTVRNAHSAAISGDPNTRKRAIRRRRGTHGRKILERSTVNSVTAVEFISSNTIASAGAGDGRVKLWDLRGSCANFLNRPVPLLTLTASEKGRGLSSLAFNSSVSRLMASCVNGIIYMYDTARLMTAPVAEFSGHQAGSFFLRCAFSPDGLCVLSGSSGKEAALWRISEMNQSPMQLEGHSSEVSGVDWCIADPTKLATCSDDGTVMVWRARRKDSSNENTRDGHASNQLVGSVKCPSTST